MATNPTFIRRLGIALRVLAGGDAGEVSRIAGLEMDLKERDARIERMQREFGIERQRADSAASGAVEAGIEDLVRHAASPFANLRAMRARHERGDEVRVADVLRLTDKIEKLFIERGLEPVGAVDDQVPFDSKLHQRMSGGDVSDGDPVRVRFVGYRFKDKIVAKAMVSRADAGNGEGEKEGENHG
jgi:molecular chaperone GrpE